VVHCSIFFKRILLRKLRLGASRGELNKRVSTLRYAAALATRTFRFFFASACESNFMTPSAIGVT